MPLVIVYGYPDANGIGQRKAIAGDGITTAEDAEEIMEKARHQHIFPSGFNRVEYALAEVAEPQAFISAEVAGIVQGGFKKNLEQQAKERAAAKLIAEKANYASQADKVFAEAAKRRNEAVGKVAAQRNILASDTLSENAKPSILAKIEKLQPDADIAIAAFEIVLGARNAIKNPKSTPEAIEKALIDLKLKTAPATTN